MNGFLGRFMQYFPDRSNIRMNTKKDLESRKKAERTKLKQNLRDSIARALRNRSS